MAQQKLYLSHEWEAERLRKMDYNSLFQEHACLRQGLLEKVSLIEYRRLMCVIHHDEYEIDKLSYTNEMFLSDMSNALEQMERIETEIQRRYIP